MTEQMTMEAFIEAPQRVTPLFTKDCTVRLFEAFAGIGCQAMALKRLGVRYETVGISEIDKFAITAYEAIHGKVHNYGDITKMQEIPPCDIFTWSFPCTDLSKAGKQAGMDKGTRSGLAWEIPRLLKASIEKPKVLVMENVVDLVQDKFFFGFNVLKNEIASLGYRNHVIVMNAKDYGVAQNRERVFMVSILDDRYYEFPMPMKLTKRLKDYLEAVVDEKYYLSSKDIIPFGSYFTWKDKQGNINTECNRAAPVDSYALTVAVAESGKVIVPEATSSGFALASDGDSVNLTQPNSQTRRGRVGKGIAQTLLTGQEQAVVEPSIIVIGKLSASEDGFIVSPEGISKTHTAGHNNQPKIQEPSLRIRKLTPRECWRLMSIDDEDFEKASKVVSNSQLYRQAGNGLIVDVFAGIIRNLFTPNGERRTNEGN